jgi:hypothetical protein
VRSRLEPAWVYSCKTRIWRVVPTSKWILIEERDIEHKAAMFSCLDRLSGEVVWGGKSFVDSWWVGVEGVSEDNLYVHGYSVPDMPFHKGITAIDIASGMVIWSQDGLVYERAVSDGVVASTGTPGTRTFSLLRGQDGSLIDKWDELEHARRILTQTDVLHGCLFPLLVYEDSHDIPLVLRRYIQKENTLWPLEFASVGRYVVYSHLIAGSGTSRVDQIIEVLREGEDYPAYREITDRSVDGFVTDSFFIQEVMLYFVIGRHTIHAVPL